MGGEDEEDDEDEEDEEDDEDDEDDEGEEDDDEGEEDEEDEEDERLVSQVMTSTWTHSSCGHSFFASSTVMPRFTPKGRQL